MVTDRFLDEVLAGDLQACVDSSVVDDKPGNPLVSTVALQGEDETRALVAMRMRGGESDGVAGHVRFAEAEDEWKLDRLENDYLRSVFDVGLGEIDESAVSTPEMQACMGKQFDKLSASELRSFTFTSLADPDKGAMQALALAKRIREELTTWLLLTDITSELLVEKPNFAVMAALEGIAQGAKQNRDDE